MFRSTSHSKSLHLSFSSQLGSGVRVIDCNYYRSHGQITEPSDSCRHSKKEKKERRIHKPPPKSRRPISFIHILKHTSGSKEALNLFEDFQQMGFKHDYPSYSAVIYRLARSRDFEKINPLLDLIRARNVRCKEALFIALMKHYANVNLIDTCVALFHRMRSFNCDRTLQSFNTVLNVLVDNGRFSDANDMFKRCSELGLRPNCVTFNVIIKGWLGLGKIEEARQVFDGMLGKEIRPTVVTYNSFIGFQCGKGEPEKGMKLLNDMIGRGIFPNPVTYAHVMEGFCHLGRYEEAKKLMFDMEYKGCRPQLVNYGVLMNDLARRGKIDEAKSLMLEMKKRRLKPDAAAYNIMITYLCKEGKVEQAYKIIVEMQLKGCKPNAASYRMLVDGFCQVGMFERGLGVLNAMLIERHCPRLETFQSLAVGLLNLGKIEGASFVLEEMEKRKMIFERGVWEPLVRGSCGKDQLDDPFLNELIFYRYERFNISRLFGCIESPMLCSNSEVYTGLRKCEICVASTNCLLPVKFQISAGI